ncbi:uncharacterized protein TM35_000471530 [Trypanosoma theileri]|uniref:Uncharacterized protein n=1 Tax=Trypanosoma theileri TaxID=67003 RepID=A0A1X0NIA9_9TRYP|nr:uncharacterized protein TM35_000471530 [Trypanosoma theileri]ORC84258.1 hypothetical protein TM35_000471530 [Trypanosoma theileri]
MDGEQKVKQQKAGDTLEVQTPLNASKPETVLSSPHAHTVQDVSINQRSEVTEQTESTQKQPLPSESDERRTEGQQEQIKETAHGPQQDNHNEDPRATGTTSTESHVTADSNPHPTTDASPSEITQSGLSTGDSKTLNNMSTEPNSTTDNVTTSEENESTNGVNTMGTSSEGNTTVNTDSVTLNITSNQESISTTTTTTNTNTIPPVPGISNDTIMPNVKGDADSSSSISSSVWVRVPLLIMVTLACILVC